MLWCSRRTKNKMLSSQLCLSSPPPPLQHPSSPCCHLSPPARVPLRHRAPSLCVPRPSRLSRRVCVCGFRARGQGEASSAKCNAFCQADKDKLILSSTKHRRSPFAASTIGVTCRPTSVCEGEMVHISGV